MDEIMSAFLKFGASLILPSETYNTLFNRHAQYQQLYNGTGDEPNSLRTDALEEVKRKDGSVSLDIGTRETGKTVLAHRLAEYYGRPTYSVSPEEKTLARFSARIVRSATDTSLASLRRKLLI